MVANRYIQLEKIGEGGMGTIFRVQDRLSGEILALKRLDIPHHHLSGRDSHAFRLALAQEFRTPA